MDLQGPNQRTQLANALFDLIRLFLFVDSDVIWEVGLFFKKFCYILSVVDCQHFFVAMEVQGNSLKSGFGVPETKPWDPSLA